MNDGRTKTVQQMEYIKMKVLSLFDGMSCGQIALQRLGIDVEKTMIGKITNSVHLCMHLKI